MHFVIKDRLNKRLNFQKVPRTNLNLRKADSRKYSRLIAA